MVYQHSMALLVGVAVLAVAMMMQPAIVLSLLGVAAGLFLAYVSYYMMRYRQTAFPEARQMLMARVQSGLAVRTRNYDLYLPSSTKEHTKKQSNSSSIKDKQSTECSSNNNNSKALMFLPGAFVDHTAYAALAIQLAERYGILVAVLSLEPTRLSQFISGVTTSKLVKLSKEIEGRASSSMVVRSSSGETYEWNLGGHSLGAQTGMELFPWLQMDHGWKKFVCLRAGMPPDAPRTLNRHNTLVVQASNDGFQSFYNDQDLLSYSVAKIKGGNHAGVAHYGPQLFPVKDGAREISLEKQQEATATAMADFIFL